MIRLILVNIGIGLNWSLFLLSLGLNIIRVYVIVNDPIIPWEHLLFWFLINIMYSVIMTTFYVDEEISGKIIRDKSPVTSYFLKELDKVAEPVIGKKLLIRNTIRSKEQTTIPKEPELVVEETELVVK